MTSVNPVPDRLVNLRDLGAGGPLPVAGMLLRSDAPMSSDLRPELGTWPPRTVIDLRGEAERREVHPLAGEATVVDLPLLGGGRSRREPRRWPDRLAEMYLGLLTAPSSDRLVEAIAVIAEAEPPVLVHCTAGKDRTGVTVAVALRLVGIESEEIVADYLLTDAAMPQVLARMSATVRERTEGTSLATPPPHIAATLREAMVELIEALDAFDGGAVGWYLSRGGSEATLTQLRRRLLGAPTAH
ncbi:hypothetical protein GCM10009798_34540 [Nocardioides panacihumi]|uniref:Tyrosine-protein phosphatase n=1 Tax=Nocardioides panacihumi TaxID=400774 RepID=A0ABP5D198_9ACTN